MSAVCRCGHSRAAHDHDHTRTYCAFCRSCDRFRRDWLSGIRRRPHPNSFGRPHT